MRHLHRYTLLFVCCALQARPLLAAAPAPQVVVGDKVAPCSPPPFVQGGEVYLPLSFTYPGLPISADTDTAAVILRGPGETVAKVPVVQRDGHIFYSAMRAAPGLRLGAHYDDQQQKLYLAPSLIAIRPEMVDRIMTLRITSRYPVTPRVSVPDKPARLVVEVPNAQLFTESTTIPVSQAGFTRIRAEQVSYEPSLVRITVEMAGTPRYRVLSGPTTAQVRVRVAVPDLLAGDARAAVERQMDAPDTEAATMQVTGVGVEYDDAGNTRIVVRTNGAPQGQTELLDAPARLALDIPNATMAAEAPTLVPATPLVRGVRIGQYADNVARVVVDLAEEVDFAISQGPDPGTLILNLRSALGVPAHGLVGLKVWIDAGHGGSLSGTTGLSGRREQDVNLDVAKRLYGLLEKAGARPNMTRFGDDTVGLYARPARANAWHAHVFVSIHCNSYGERRPTNNRGIETYYCWPHSLPLAQAVHSQVVRELGAPDRRVRHRPGLVVTRETKMPSILVEIGYMDNQEEDRLLGTEEYRQRVAQAICDGIARYANGNKPLESGSLEQGGTGTASVAAGTSEVLQW